MTDKVWTEEELKKASESLEGKGPEAAIEWVLANFGRDEFALASSFAECVLVDMLIRLKPDARVFYLDTGLLFKETIDVVEAVEKKYGIKVERYAPEMSLDEM